MLSSGLLGLTGMIRRQCGGDPVFDPVADDMGGPHARSGRQAKVKLGKDRATRLASPQVIHLVSTVRRVTMAVATIMRQPPEDPAKIGPDHRLDFCHCPSLRQYQADRKTQEGAVA